MSKRPTTPYAFFLKHSGYSYDPATETETETQGRRRCARETAAAEAAAIAAGATWEWHHDPDGEDADGKRTSDYYGCVLRDASGEALASLWNIDDATMPYRRVVQGELALEAFGRD